MPESLSKRHRARLDVVMEATLYRFFFFLFTQFCGRHTRIEDTKKAEQNGTCLIIGLTVRNEIKMSSSYLQQQSANVHRINSTVSKESAFGR